MSDPVVSLCGVDSDATPTFVLTTRTVRADVALVDVRGELDVETAYVLRTRALALIGQGHRHLVLNLADVEFCDSTGVSVVVALFRHTRARHGTLALAAVPDRIRRVLRLTGVSRFVTDHPCVAQALAAIPRVGPDAHRPKLLAMPAGPNPGSRLTSSTSPYDPRANQDCALY
ncbi:STAS domain-containing protein [Embleya sp. NPDC001921]